MQPLSWSRTPLHAWQAPPASAARPQHSAWLIAARPWPRHVWPGAIGTTIVSGMSGLGGSAGGACGSGGDGGAAGSGGGATGGAKGLGGQVPWCRQ